MAAETPFASSFGNYGDPRRYMNKGESPGKKVEQFVAKIKNSPLANLAGILLAGGGEESASSPVPAPALGQGLSVPVAPSIGMNPNARSGTGIAPGSFQTPNLVLPQITDFNAPPSNADLDGDGQVDKFWGVNPANVPQPTSSPQSFRAPVVSQPIADVTNKTDFNPLGPDVNNQVALTGNEYQQIPGFGSAQEKAGKLMKIMGMG
jgi:hypothetical protein